MRRLVGPGANIAHCAVPIDVPKTAAKHMLLPKPAKRQRTPYVPVVTGHALQSLIRKAAPDEVRALAWIAEFAEVVPLPDDPAESVVSPPWWRTYGACGLLIVPITPKVLDTLAAFDAEAEDRENDHDDEIEEDGSMYDDKEPDHDDEYDYRAPRARPDPLWSSGSQSVPVMDRNRYRPT